MAREMINDKDIEQVVGGSIVFSTDHTTCGLNCNNQCKVNDYNAALKFIKENYYTMSEKDIMRNLVAKGYITRL